MSRLHKILFTGPMGVGKTTCIGALSEIPPVTTEAVNTDQETAAKATTTVALDYGELTLEGEEKVRLVATPGQLRFDFMWSILAKGALGVIVLIDNSLADPLGDLQTYLGHFSEFARGSRMVVGVTRTETHAVPTVESYYQYLSGLGLSLPVLSVDVRRRSDALMLIDVLLSELVYAQAP
jgi:signal recognition particle receptor subunit beta